MFAYYTRIAEFMLPHIAGRPATRKRWPNGVEEASFFEKQLAASAPDWLNRESVTHKSGITTYPIIDSPAALAWIAQQAALEVHVPQWRFVNGKSPGRRHVWCSISIPDRASRWHRSWTSHGRSETCSATSG